MIECRLEVAHQDAILRAQRTGNARLNAAQVQFQRVVVFWIRHAVGAEQSLFLAVGVHQLHEVFVAAGAAQVAEHFVIHREETHRRAIFGRHIGDGGAVGQGHAAQAGTVKLDELADDAFGAQHLCHDEHEVGGGCAFGQLTYQLEADHLGHKHVDRLTEHGRFRFDTADTPAKHAQAVDHRRVTVGADQRIGQCNHATALRIVINLHDLGQILEIDLVHDASGGRHDL